MYIELKLQCEFVYFLLGYGNAQKLICRGYVERSSDQGKEEEYLWCEVGGWGITIPQLDKSTPRNWVSLYI